MQQGGGYPSAGSSSPASSSSAAMQRNIAPSIDTLSTHGIRVLQTDKSHANLYATLSCSTHAVQSVLRRTHPDAFQYELQDHVVVTYLANADWHREQGFCTLLPWGHIFTDLHQPLTHMFRITSRVVTVSVCSTVLDVHKHGIGSCDDSRQYKIYALHPMTIAPWHSVVPLAVPQDAEDVFWGFQDGM